MRLHGWSRISRDYVCHWPKRPEYFLSFHFSSVQSLRHNRGTNIFTYEGSQSENVSSSVVSDSLWPPWTVAHQAPLSMGLSIQEYWSGFPFPSPGDLPNPGFDPGSPALQTDSLLSEPSGKFHTWETGNPRRGRLRPEFLLSKNW